MKNALVGLGLLGIGAALLLGKKAQAAVLHPPGADGIDPAPPAPVRSPVRSPVRPAAPPIPPMAGQAVKIPAGYRALSRADSDSLASQIKQMVALGDPPGTLYPFVDAGRNLAVLVVATGNGRAGVLLQQGSSV